MYNIESEVYFINIDIDITNNFGHYESFSVVHHDIIQPQETQPTEPKLKLEKVFKGLEQVSSLFCIRRY